MGEIFSSPTFWASLFVGSVMLLGALDQSPHWHTQGWLSCYSCNFNVYPFCKHFPNGSGPRHTLVSTARAGTNAPELS